MHPLARLEACFSAHGAIVAGVLSGTSADGIDVALCRMRTQAGVLLPPELLVFETRPFPAPLQHPLRALLDGAACNLREAALLSRDLGHAFGREARALADAHGLALDLVGSHGQTVYHHDGCEPSGPASLQLGELDHVAEEAGCTVAGDFRQRDLAAGGQGAPISALADDLIFGHLARPLAVLNLGGMGNLTLLGAGGELGSFDTGPAGSLLDGLARACLGRPYDPEGSHAARGKPCLELVERWLEHPFFQVPPPRSTGRDTFGAAWVAARLAEARAARIVEPEGSPHDVLATAVEFVARSVADTLRTYSLEPPRELLVAGGGVHHAPLLRRLGDLASCPVLSSALRGVDPDAREGLVFAVLAARTVLAIPCTSPGATGARAGRVLGKLSWGLPGA